MRKARVRVALLERGADLYDLNTGIERTLAELPEWMNESIAMLNMMNIGDEVPGLGSRNKVAPFRPPVYYLTIRGEIPNED